MTDNAPRHWRSLLAWALACAALGLAPGVSAQIITGYVYTHDTVENDEGQITWVEYDPQTGEQVGVIDQGESKYPSSEWRAMGIREFNNYVERYQDAQERIPELGEPMARADVESTDFTTVNDEPIDGPKLAEGTAYVSVLPKSRRITNDPESLIVEEYPFDPSAHADIREGSTHSMLLKTGRGGDQPQGTIEQTTANRIGKQTAYLQDEDGQPVSGVFTSNLVTPGGSGYKPLAPMPDTYVSVFPWGGDMTGDDGKYSYTTVNNLFCPVPVLNYYSVTAHYRYQRFNPKKEGGEGLYVQTRDVELPCSSPTQVVPLVGPVSFGINTQHSDLVRLDFPVDVSAISGEARFGRVTSVAGRQVRLQRIGGTVQKQGSGETRYQSIEVNEDTEAPPDLEQPQPPLAGLDLDGDGEAEDIRRGYYTQDTDNPDGRIFVQADQAPEYEDLMIGVWLSGNERPDGEGLPDFARALDQVSFSNFEHEGVVDQISFGDVQNTDIYVVRLSDGKLISERLGLHEQEANSNNFGASAENNSFFYSMLIPGKQSDLARDHSTRTFEEIQSEAGINPELHEKNTDRLQPGDRIRIIAINRATGYMGTVDTTLQEGGSNAGGNLSFPIDDMVMGPPNLRVEVTRDYNVQAGLNAGDLREDQIVGFEGASLSSDNFVAVHTEWLDHQGRPIPEALNGAGYTGRLATLAGDKQLPTNATGVSQFDVNPGRNLQVIQLPGGGNNSVVKGALSDRHYYIHINGEPSSGTPIFADTENRRLGGGPNFSTGENQGMLASRPNNYVPFLVKVFNEQRTQGQRDLYYDIKADDQIADSVKDDLEEPEPVYRWAYRPEMQFSNYSFEMDSVTAGADSDDDGRIDDENGVTQATDSLFPVQPGDVLEVLYSLSAPDLEALDYINAGENKELLFRFGHQEVNAEVTDDGRIVFPQNEHINLLRPGEHLTLALYANNDMGNTLYEWSFGTSGFHASFEYPGDEIRMTPVPDPQAPESEPRGYWTLGGARLKFGYNFPAETNPRELVFKIDIPSRVCTEFNQPAGQCDNPDGDGSDGGEIVLEEFENTDDSAGPEVARDWEIYWQPLLEDLEPWQLGLDATLKVELTYREKDGTVVHYTDDNVDSGSSGEDAETITNPAITHWIRNRELGPESDDGDPPKGDDVAMLEAMLWQLGLSAQYGWPGRTGARINSDRGEDLVWTHDCQGNEARTRERYLVGWSDECEEGQVSTEGMVRRFQARHASGGSHGGIGPITIGNQDGIVGSQTLGWIERTWGLYMSAYDQWGQRPVINIDSEVGVNDSEWDRWRSSAVDIWQNGIQGTTSVPRTYTDAIHNTVLTLAGVETGGEQMTRSDLLDAWINREASFHWGSGSPATDYRMHEGGADEEGSLSFNQVLFRYWASDDPCPAHEDADLNYLMPDENLSGFAVHTAASGGVCSGSFARGFEQDDLSETRPASSPNTRQLSDLVGYRHGGGNVKQIGSCPDGEHDCGNYVSPEEDAYEVLAKAVALYNGAGDILLGEPWPTVLKTVALADESGSNVTDPEGGGPDQCYSCQYSIDIRNDLGMGPTEEELGLPHRTYIWYGGVWGDDVDADFAGEDWCFAYGESQWRRGISFDDVIDAVDPPIGERPDGRMNCTTGSPMELDQ